MGWMGNASELLSYLSVIGADKDEEGNYLIGGAPVTSGMDPTEVVVPAETVYFVDGKSVPLAANMPESRGLKVRVF